MQTSFAADEQCSGLTLRVGEDGELDSLQIFVRADWPDDGVQWSLRSSSGGDARRASASSSCQGEEDEALAASATRIQSSFRGRKSRRDVGKLRVEKEERYG